MHVEATVKPIRYRLRSGEEIVLRPGVPTEIPDASAPELLRKAGDQIRVASEVTIEPAYPTARPAYWEQADGRILGPGDPQSSLKSRMVNVSISGC